MDNSNDKIMQTYDFLCEFIEEYGYPPSVREICHALGYKSTATAFIYLNKLEEMGKITKAKTANRAIRIVDNMRNIIRIPVIGKIAAGVPITAEENIEEEIPLPAGFFKSGELFILKVQGDSMINAGIFENDRLVFRKQQTANNGEIVAAIIDGEATVKRFYKESDRIRLQPENDRLEPIYTRECEIIGVVTGLLRSYK